jgi:opacity protein-like surface antigen
MRGQAHRALVLAFGLAWVARLPAATEGGSPPEVLSAASTTWDPGTEPEPDTAGTSPPSGAGFPQGTFRAGLAFGCGIGPAWFGSTERHALLLSNLQLGWMATGLLGPDRFYAGNLELMVDILGGWQHSPEDAYLAGLAPVLRYNLAAGSGWLPFLEAGAGLVATDIRSPDLSTDLEFRTLVGLGVNYRLNDRMAVGLGGRFEHISNAEIAEPNHGVNEFEILVGWSWYF